MKNEKIGTNEIGNNADFTMICNKCKSEDVELIPIHYYENGDYKNPKKITLTFRCKHCMNEYRVNIHNR